MISRLHWGRHFERPLSGVLWKAYDIITSQYVNHWQRASPYVYCGISQQSFTLHTLPCPLMWWGMSKSQILQMNVTHIPLQLSHWHSGKVRLFIRKSVGSYITEELPNIQSAHYIPWWRHQMETFSALLAICAGNSPVTGEFPAQRPVTQSFDAFFYLLPNKRPSKQWWGWWFETSSCPLWRHCNALHELIVQQ